MSAPRLPNKLTVVIRDETPLHIQEPCAYRRITIDLTPEQQAQLSLRFLGTNGGFEMFEQVSVAFLEFPREQA